MTSASANLRGMALMTLAMGIFALEDAMIKLATRDLPAGQVMLTIAVLSLPVFLIRSRRQPSWPPGVPRAPVLWRTAFEVVATCGILLGLASAALSTVTVIAQAAPFMVAAAALILGEKVGWRRWAAVVTGFSGVLVILRPGPAGVEPGALWALMGTVAICARDLAAHRVDPAIPTATVAVCGLTGVVLFSLTLLTIEGGPALPTPRALAALLAGSVCGIVAYWSIIEATRAGDVSAITPFRYSRLVFGIGLGVLLFGEAVDRYTALGAALILAAGLYALYRERLRALEARATANPEPPHPEPRP